MGHEGLMEGRVRQDRVYLRAAVLRVGALLGWKAHEVIGFTEALTGRGWRHCGPDEFQIVLDEYLALRRVIQGTVSRGASSARELCVTGATDAPAD